MQPQISNSLQGAQFKILDVTGPKGQQMPLHFSTQEAIIIVLKGHALLKLGETDIYLQTNESVIVPAATPHSLLIEADFQAKVIMALESQIKFIHQ